MEKAAPLSPPPGELGSPVARSGAASVPSSPADGDDDLLPIKFALSIPYCFVSTIPALRRAVAKLVAPYDAWTPESPAPRPSGVACDLEGVNLGRTGVIATMQLCARARAPVYIIDIVGLGEEAFAYGVGLRELLERADIQKLFWDVRSDANALFHHFGVDMPAASIVDLQLLYLAHAVESGQRADRLMALGFIFDRTTLARLTQPEVLRMAEVKAEARAMFSPESGGSYAVWLERPLPALLLEYATDVRHFHALLTNVATTRLRSEPARAVLLEAVDRRLHTARSLEFSSANREENIAVDDVLVRAIRRLVATQAVRR